MSLEKGIELLYKRHSVYKKPLQEIVNNMLDKCRYVNGESLERHNWGTSPNKLKYIPGENDSKFEYYLLKALEHNENENIDNSTIEVLWGDVQLGKRIQACIIMWFSVHILKRPVLYIFRNLTIDQKQLQEDIIGTNEFSFNTVFIKNIFKKYNDEINDILGENRNDHYKDFILPELKEINTIEALNKLKCKKAINPRDIFCCLMNNTQLDKINTKFSEYIFNHNELLNMTILIDESDLMSPTAHNDRTDKEYIVSAECEKLLAKIYKKSKYVLHITGTAHSLLYNVTTKLIFNNDYEEVKETDKLKDVGNDDNDNDNDNSSVDSALVPIKFIEYYVNLKVSKVHKMKRNEDYYGIFNDKIVFNTSEITEWWLDDKNNKFSIEKDYKHNIKNIISIIANRKDYKYNSLLISEERIREEQFALAELIMNDFKGLFIIIFHGKKLRLYFDKIYDAKLKESVRKDSNILKKDRLNIIGGIFEDYNIYTSDKKNKLLKNNYCYYDLNPQKCTIKMIYKVLSILFNDNKNLTSNTAITITGKYGERGYSFTSDDFGKYSLHLTDQYFLSHSRFNCTDISQRLRIQGKYNDEELYNGTMQLTLWTTFKFKDIVQNFYVRFIKEIEKVIMEQYSWINIKKSIEDIIDDGYIQLNKYLKYLDTSKKTRNILIVTKKYDNDIKGYKLININGLTDEKISEWCKNHNLPEYICINEFINSKELELKLKHQKQIIKEVFFETFNKLEDLIQFCESRDIPSPDRQWFKQFKCVRKLKKPKCYIGKTVTYLKYSDIIPSSLKWGLAGNTQQQFNIYYEDDDMEYNNPKYMIRYNSECEMYGMDKIKNENFDLNPIYNNNEMYNAVIKLDDKYLFSKIKDEYRDEYPKNYYWKTLDNWLCLYKRDKSDILQIKIKEMPKDVFIRMNGIRYIRSENEIFTIKDNKKYQFYCPTYKNTDGRWVVDLEDLPT